MLSLKNTSILKDLVGDSIESIGSTTLNVHNESIVSLEMNLLITCKRNSIFFICDHKNGFFENANSETFYDFEITRNISVKLPIKNNISLVSSRILEIEIYGRNFNSNEFKDFPQLYKKLKGEYRTDDLFLIKLVNGEKILLTFHPFMPSIEVFLKNEWIHKFWEEYGNLYKKHYTIC
jgi:hypothetical protein